MAIPVLMGTASRGPVNVPLAGRHIWRFPSTVWTSVDLSTSGTATIASGATGVAMMRYGRRGFYQTELRETGDLYQYRLKQFPVIASSLVVTVDGSVLSAVTTTPSATEYRITAATGLLELGVTPSTLEVRYDAGVGKLEPTGVVGFAVSGVTVTWLGAASQTDEAWLRYEPAVNDDSLISGWRRANEPNLRAMRVDQAGVALLTVASGAATLVLQSEPGTDGNLWKAVWDQDAVHILRAPGYEPRRFTIPLTSDAATYWGMPWDPDNDSMVLQWGDLLATVSGTLAGGANLTPGSGTYTGGTSGTIDWDESLEYASTGVEQIYVPLGASDPEPLARRLDLDEEKGIWSLGLIASNAQITSVSTERIAAIAGTVRYRDSAEATPLPVVAAALTRGNPYRIPEVQALPPNTPLSGLIYVFDTVRHGAMLTRLSMTSGTLALNHHLWLQQLAERMRTFMTRYLGRLDVTEALLTADPDFRQLISDTGAEYSLTIAREVVDLALEVRVPGVVSEVQVRVQSATGAPAG